MAYKDYGACSYPSQRKNQRMNFLDHMPKTQPIYKAIRHNGYAHLFTGGPVREACRWIHADFGFYSTAHFIPLPRFGGASNSILDEVNR